MIFSASGKGKEKNGKKKRKLDIDERGGLVVYFIKVFLYIKKGDVFL